MASRRLVTSVQARLAVARYRHTAQIGAETLTRAAVVTPRYRVTHQTAFFSTEDACDSIFELSTDWVVNRYVADLLERRWEFDWANAALSGHALGDSVLSVDVTVEEGRATPIRYRVFEIDPVETDFLDNPSETFVDLDPLLGNRTVEIEFGEETWVDNPCHATITVHVQVSLLTPGLAGGPVASQ